MSDYNKRLLGISVGAIFYIIFFLLDWDDLFSEINFNQDRSFLFDVFDTTYSHDEERMQWVWSILSIAWIGGFWLFRDTVGNFVFSIFQWIKVNKYVYKKHKYNFLTSEETKKKYITNME